MQCLLDYKCKEQVKTTGLFSQGYKLYNAQFVVYFCTNSQYMETTEVAPIQLSVRAVAEIKRLMAAPDFDHSKSLRIGVKGGGCSGMSYILGFDEKQPADQTFETDDLIYIMNPGHGIYLLGMEIDWQDGLNARGFTFTNPNASKTCGCGTSFAV